MKKIILHELIFLFTILFLGLLLRVFLLPYGNHIDLIINAEWGRWIYEHGSKNFYTNNVWIYGWPTQLPLINLIYSFNNLIYQQLSWYFMYLYQSAVKYNFPDLIINNAGNLVNWWSYQNFGETPFQNGYLISMKIIPVLSDLLIALIIYFYSKGRKKILVTSLYIFFPFSWYLSSLWGQYDQFASLLVLLSIISLAPKINILSILSPSIMLFAFQIKPNMVFIIPLYIFYYVLCVKKKYFIYLLSLMLVLVVNWWIFKPFISESGYQYLITNIITKVFNDDRFALVNRAFNFWQLLFPHGGWSTVIKILKIPILYWGQLFWLIISLFGIRRIVKNNKLDSIIETLWAISGGVYLFMTGMVDRYFFLSLVLLFFISSRRISIIKLLVICSFLFSFNLFYSWGYPFLLNYQAWSNKSLVMLLSLINVAIFLWIVYFKVQRNEK